MKPPVPPKAPDRIRLTISVTPEVHATFSRLAQATSQSLGSTMGEWLSDTMDAADHTAGLVERARAAPKEVMREVHAYAMGLADETGTLMRSMGVKGGTPVQLAAAGIGSAAAALSRGRGAADALPPSSNTGGKVPLAKRQKQGGRRS